MISANQRMQINKVEEKRHKSRPNWPKICLVVLHSQFFLCGFILYLDRYRKNETYRCEDRFIKAVNNIGNVLVSNLILLSILLLE